MRYLGGKKRLAKRIATILDEHRNDGQLFVDMFCGSLAVSAAMPSRGPHIANDACEPLINMYRAWREGWRPPEFVSEELYAELKAKQDPSDPLTAFVGFGCSYGGKWFGGYARSRVKAGTHYICRSSYSGPTEFLNYADVSGRAVKRVLTACVDAELLSSNFQLLEISPGALVYCDPEYRGTTRYSYFKGFDHDAFEDCAQRWADSGATVFVSEYAAQRETWEQVAEWSSKKNIAKSTRVERLFRVHPTITRQ